MTTQFSVEDLERNWQQNPLEVIKGLVAAIGGLEGDLAAAHQLITTLGTQFAELKLKLTALDMQARTGARHEVCRGCMQIEIVTLGGVFMPHSSLRSGGKCPNSGGPVYG